MICTVVFAACGSACFGEGDGEVHYRDVNCSNAMSFNNCIRHNAGSGMCGDHSRDAGVVCGNCNFE